MRSIYPKKVCTALPLNDPDTNSHDLHEYVELNQWPSNSCTKSSKCWCILTPQRLMGHYLNMQKKQLEPLKCAFVS